MSNNCNCEDIIIKISEEGVDGNGIVNIELISEVGLEKTYRINFTNGTYFDYVVTDGSSIQSIEKTSTQGLVDTYTITLTSGETMTFEVTNGNGIASIVKTKTENLTDTYTISFTDGTSTTFTVNNGNSITGVTKVSTQVLTDTYRIGYSDTGKAPDTFTVVNGRGITAIAKVSSSGLQDTYRISYNDGTSSNFTVTNGMPATHSWNGTILTITSASGTSSADLKGEKGDSATIAIGTVTTGAEGSSASVTNRGDEHDAIWDITIPRGNTGNGISSITLLSQSGLVKTYRITYTNGTHFDFSVSDGNGIASIEKTGTSGAVDTYTVTFTDPNATPFSYDVTNGSDTWGAIVGDISDQTDLQQALDNKAPVITESASGDIVTIADGADLPVEALSVSVEAVQDLHGYDAPWPAGGGANLVDETASFSSPYGGISSAFANGTWTVSNTGSANRTGYLPEIALSAGTYYISVTNTDNSVQAKTSDGVTTLATINSTTKSATFTLNESTSINILTSVNAGQTAAITKLMLSAQNVPYAPYSNICPISGWTNTNVTRTNLNIWGGEKMANDMVAAVNNSTYCAKGEDTNGKYVTLTAHNNMSLKNITSTVKFKPNIRYTIVFKWKSSANYSGTNIGIEYTDGTHTYINKPDATTANTVYTFAVTSASGKTIDYIESINAGGTTYFYYESCAVLEGVHTVDEFTPYVGTTLPINWQSEAGTVYGATLDVGAGTLTVDMDIVDLGSLNWIYLTDSRLDVGGYFRANRIYSKARETKMISSVYPIIHEVYGLGNIINMYGAGIDNLIYQDGSTEGSYIYVLAGTYSGDATAFKTAVTGQTIVYPLTTPIVITGLTPAIMRTLLGYNAIWADCGAVSVDYRADTKLYVDGQIREAVTAVKRIMTTTTDTMVAPKNLTTGEIVIVGDELYKATANIASGATLTVGSNVVKVTLAEWVASLVA